MAKKETTGKKTAKEEYRQMHDNGKSSTTSTGQKDTGSRKAREAASKEKKPEKKSSSRKTHSYKEEYEAMHDKYLRLSAEFDNYRKRTLKEKADLTKFAGEGLLTSLLPVIDDFDRAIQLMPEDDSCRAMKEGTLLIYNKFKEYLRQNGVEEIEALHKDFDTDVHEAVTKIPAPEKKLKGKVVDVIQKGYFLNGKVLRYAKVVIGE